MRRRHGHGERSPPAAARPSARWSLMVPSPLAPPRPSPQTAQRRSEPHPANQQCVAVDSTCLWAGPGPFARMIRSRAHGRSRRHCGSASPPAPPLTIEVPDSGRDRPRRRLPPEQRLGRDRLPGGVTPNRRNAIKAYGQPDGKNPQGCPNKWKTLGLRMVTADFGGGPACAAHDAGPAARDHRRAVATERGLKVGDSLDRVRELYPELQQLPNDLYGDEQALPLRLGARARGVAGRRPAERDRPPVGGDPRPQGRSFTCRRTARATSVCGREPRPSLHARRGQRRRCPLGASTSSPRCATPARG